MAGAARFEDLTVWQRMHELDVEVWRATQHGAVSRNFEFCDEIQDAANSAARNVAEGFGRFNPREFARFLDISRASALETRARLVKGRAVGYFSDEDFTRLDALATRGIQALAKFQRYLRSPEARRNAERRYRRKRRKSQPSDPNGPNGPNGPNDPNDPNGPND